MSNDAPHIPVLLNEVLAALEINQGDHILDGTFGAGGYSLAILGAGASKVFAIDRDPTALEAGWKLPQSIDGSLDLRQGCFGDMDDVLNADAPVDGVVLDIGVSSMQLDQAERGFSFAKDGPLDMRMSCTGLSAADVVNKFDEEEIANILYQFGEERQSRRIARAIVEDRKTEKFETTLQLAGLISRVVKKSKDGIHPATRAFQGLRIYVNDELGELTRGLEAAERILKPGGRLVVVTFHSLEDRVVKNFLKERSGEASGPSRHLPITAQGPDATFKLSHRKAVSATDEEIRQNPRSRSAKLRAAIRTTAPARLGRGGAV